MKPSKILLLTLLFFLTFIGPANAINIITDSVEPNEGWAGTNAFNGGFGLTTPIAGPNMALFASQNSESYSQTFIGVVLEEGATRCLFTRIISQMRPYLRA
jgi:hypothetical protein